MHTIIPVLDLSDAFDPNFRAKFLADLRHSVIDIGFFVLTNFWTHGPSENDFNEITSQARSLFASSDAIKDEVAMVNSPHFLGYTRLGCEITAKKQDWREQIDLATELPPPFEGLPLYRQIEGPNLWPDSEALPLFRPRVERYLGKMTQLSVTIRKLLAVALELDENAFEHLFKENQQCKMKLISYPDCSEISQSDSVSSEIQGVGPHRDSDFITFIYQATEHKNCLQVQNFKGEWISVNPEKGSLVVNGGQTLEAITGGVCKAAIHRVVLPSSGSGTRISIPFFLTINLDCCKTMITNLPQLVMKMKEERDKLIKHWGAGVGFQFSPDIDQRPVGEAVFLNRIKAHQDVAKRWYPEVLEDVLKMY